MSAAEQTPVQGAAVVLMTRHGATAEQAERLASVLECAGLLVHPEAAEELLEDCRAQAKAEARAEVDDLSAQLAGARSVLSLASAESYPGELEHLRALLREVCRLPETPALREVLIDHYSDCRMVDALFAERDEAGGRP